LPELPPLHLSVAEPDDLKSWITCISVGIGPWPEDRTCA
jgi:hypothetical protein